MARRVLALSLLLIYISAFSSGCSCHVEKKKEVLARVNNYEITREEFDKEFADSAYASSDMPEARKEFLATLINRKLILQYAEKIGLDRDMAFLKTVERFWEQSLVKLAVDKKSREIMGSAYVSDKEIKDEYDRRSAEGRADMPYTAMYSKIKWDLAQSKESQAMDGWLGELKSGANIKIDEDLLSKK